MPYGLPISSGGSMFPFLPVAAGIGAVSGLFHHHGSGVPLGEYDRALARGSIPGGFHFTPNENDPELMLLRRRALEEGQRNYGSQVNELSRAGLLGSSAAFGVLGNASDQNARNLEDINNQAFGQQRNEALQMYNNDLAYRRQLELSRLGGLQGLQGQKFQAGEENLGALGGLGGSFLYDYLKSRGYL